MVFTNKVRPETISLNINGSVIQERTESKFLGVILDNKLTWHAHIKHISSKISKSVAILRMLRDTFPKHILKTLYLTLVYPYFNYCNLIWGSAYNSTLNPLVILQKKCIRIICNAEFLAHTDPLFKSTKLLKLKQFHELNCPIFIYKCFNSTAYANFKIMMITSSQIHQYNTRNRDDIRPLHHRLQLGATLSLIRV